MAHCEMSTNFIILMYCLKYYLLLSKTSHFFPGALKRAKQEACHTVFLHATRPVLSEYSRYGPGIRAHRRGLIRSMAITREEDLGIAAVSLTHTCSGCLSCSIPFYREVSQSFELMALH